ncbi:MupA/Atu3671 family FMN-dependent luciferase-like monooxygenase [Streptomyces swartbergensis]|uniref:Uncharacterized protein n=1 Tax=Streptomyces swartbergensis TaxID=487165 RepID=A0A243S0F3_9ACTN|nr:MupA/Atu3671 family FMN-dependent luciferase-like monooxygenase [Streptomyces swartbergensis]OUD00926.1 hypothetical protein CA983_22985 [Streptomyces swartbergensis]
MKFSLMFFASDENALAEDARYDMLLESARFGDAHGFENVWVPERHFTPLGSLYPNPALLHAALARETSRIGLRAGSVVLPLHSPLRVAEEWAVVDNLSGGRAGISLASGWNPNDFAYFPERYAERSRHLEEGMEQLRALWRGEAITATSGTGEPVSLRTYPRPVQRELPLWLTAASSPASFARAGRTGANLLTHLLDQGVDGLAENVEVYRKARADAGLDPASGRVTVMLHSFVGADAETATELARDPYCAYLKGNMGLLKGLASSRGRDSATDIEALPEAELTQFAGFLYDRFASSRSLIGSPESCLPLVRRLAPFVDEVACLLDFGPTTAQVLDGLPHLDRLRRLAEQDPQVREAAVDRTLPEPASAVARIPAASPSPPAWEDDPEVVKARCGHTVEVAEFFDHVERAGAAYGPRMRCLEGMWVGDGEVLGRLTLPARWAEEGYVFHPALLDNAFLLLGALAPGALSGSGALTLPVGVGTLEPYRQPVGEVYSHVVRTPAAETGDELLADVRLFDAEGTVAYAQGLRMRLVDPEDGGGAPGRDLCYRTDWTAVSAARAADTESGRWLVLADMAGTGEALATALREAGDSVDVVQADAASDAARIRQALYGALADGPLKGVVLARPLDAPDLPDATTDQVRAAQQSGAEAALALVRACLDVDVPTRCGRLWLLTRGAQPAGGTAVTAAGVLQAPVWGLGRVLAAEHPELWGGLIDLDARTAPDEAASATLLSAVLTGARPDEGIPVDDQLAVRDGSLLAARLVRAEEMAAPAPAAPDIDPDGTYLLTGGLGDLGLALAGWLAERGARHLVLVGRRGVSDDTQRVAVDGLTGRGVRVHIAAADVARADDVAALRAELEREGLPPVVGVAHLAGIARGAMLAGLDVEQLREVAEPKVAGAWNLHRVFGDASLFLLVSALPAVFGPVGVGAANYAAANAFLDALAHHRRGRDTDAVALGYGPWNGIGLAVREGGLDQLSRLGVGSMAPAEALDVFGRVLARRPAQVTVARLDWPEVFTALPSARATGQFAAFLDEFGGTGGSAQLLERCAQVEPQEQRMIVGDYLTERLAAVLQTGAEDIDPQVPVVEMGLDSLMALELRVRVKADLGVVVPMVRLLEGPSVEQLTDHVLGLLTEVLGALDGDEEREEITL